MDGFVHLKSDVRAAVNAVAPNMSSGKECEVRDRRGERERKEGKRERK